MSERTETLLSSMTQEEKISLLAGHDMWHTVAIPRLGIPALKVSDGPNGARGGSFSGKPSACFPCGSALAATWDPELVQRVGRALADETRAKGARMLLAPTVNIHRTVLAGRNFECFSEDPFLSARMAAANVRGVQSGRVSVCIKHFVCNDQEHERMTISSELSDRALREIYLPPFEAAVVESGARGVMSAYNRIRGTYACENAPLLRDVLRGEYGFEGVVVSDWFGTQSTTAALEAGLDLEMPGPARHRGDQLKQALEAGEASEEALDAAAGRMLDLLEWTGALDEGGPEPEQASDGGEHRPLLREAAAEAAVLLKNEGGLLPLRADKVQKVAWIGPNAELLEPQGGGSAQVGLGEMASPAAALGEALGSAVSILEAPGCDIHRTLPALRRVASIEYFEGRELEGEALAREEVQRLHFVWMGVPAKGVSTTFSARIHCDYEVPADGRYTIGLMSAGRSRLYLDGELLVDNWTSQESGSSFFGLGSKPVDEGIELRAGQTHRIVVEYSSFPAGGLGGLTVGLLPPRPADMQAHAAEVAASADVAVLVLGSNPDWESEGRDRQSFELPGAQRSLVEAVVAANPQTVVVLNCGSPVATDWAERVPALLQLWYPGQAGPEALADVLAGRRDPGGRLPTTWPRRLEDDPAFLHYPGERGEVVYGEGIFVGYRGYEKTRTEPAFCFGHGLSYAEFEFGEVQLSSAKISAAEELEVRVPVHNRSECNGSEVVQVYVRDLEASVARPEKELKGFVKLKLAPGESSEVLVRLDSRAFSFWDPQQGQWLAEPGRFEILVGRSSGDIRSRAEVELQGA